MASVVAIFTCRTKGLPMQESVSVKALEGLGLDNDRYALGTGAYPRTDSRPRDVSLISLEAIREANRVSGTSFTMAETRRNIITTDIDLNQLVGKEFWVGDVKMYGVEPCDPCPRPGKLAGKGGTAFKTAFTQRGGLRAKILTNGIITVGDPIIKDDT